MSDPYISQIEAFAFGFAPRSWMTCAGQILAINQNQALFSLLGTTFGGNGVTTFQLPDLRSRLAVGFGPGAGLTSYALGQQAGQETVTLTTSNMPTGSHTHAINANNATSGGANQPGSSVVLSSGYLAATQGGTTTVTKEPVYSTAAPTVTMHPLSAAGGQAHSNFMPGLALNYCICVSGVYPTRN